MSPFGVGGRKPSSTELANRLRSIVARGVDEPTPGESALTREAAEVLGGFAAASKVGRFDIDDADRLLAAFDSASPIQQVWWSARVISALRSLDDVNDSSVFKYFLRMMGYRLHEAFRGPAQELATGKDWIALLRLMELVGQYLPAAQLAGGGEPAVPFLQGWSLEQLGDSQGALRAYQDAVKVSTELLDNADVGDSMRQAAERISRESRDGIARIGGAT